MKPRTRLLVIFLTAALFTFVLDQWRRRKLEASQDANILAAAARNDVDAALVKAVIWRESRFNVTARGRKKEVGLMQIMPDSTGRDWASARRLTNYSDAVLLQPQNNIDCGAWYLHKLLARYRSTDNPAAFALADYNAGRGNALRWMTGSGSTNSSQFLSQITYPTTREYVNAILKRRARYAAWAERSRTNPPAARP